jgi:anti-anti-sigma factor
MTDDLADRTIEQPLFSVSTEPPALLHLAGELDMVGAPALTEALEPLTSRGGNIGMDLAELTFMDSSGINALCQAAQALGERGRIIVLKATPSVHG